MRTDKLYYICNGKITGPLALSNEWKVNQKLRFSCTDSRNCYVGGLDDFLSEGGFSNRLAYEKGSSVTIIRVENNKAFVRGNHGVYWCEISDLSLTKQPDQGKIPKMKTAYTPPSNYKETFELILKYFPTFKIQSTDQVYKINEILNLIKVKFTIESFQKDCHRDVFESELISTLLDWPEISNDDVNFAMMIAEEYVRSIQIREMLNLLDLQLEGYLTDVNKQGSQIAVAEQQKAKSVELEKCKANIKVLSKTIKDAKEKSGKKDIGITQPKVEDVGSEKIKEITNNLFNNYISPFTQAYWEIIRKNYKPMFQKEEETFRLTLKDAENFQNLHTVAAQPNKKILVLEHKRFLLNSALSLAPGTKIDILRADDSRVNDKNYDLVIGDVNKTQEEFEETDLKEIINRLIFSKTSVILTGASWFLVKMAFEEIEKTLSKTGSKGTDRWEMKFDNGSKLTATPFSEKIRGYRADIIGLCGEGMQEEKMNLIRPMNAKIFKVKGS
jgi:hypothetical protein